MKKENTVILRELVGIRGGPTEEASYETNLMECLGACKRAMVAEEMTSAGHAARGAAECYRRLGRLNEAECQYRIATDLFKVTADSKGMAWTLYAHANFLRQRSRFVSAESHLSKALKIAKSCQDLPLIAYVLGGSAENTRILGDYGNAYRQHVKVLGLFHSLQDVRGVIWALEGLGQILKNTGRLSGAFEYFTAAKKLALKTRDLRGLAYALKCRAECLSIMGLCRAAVDEAHYAVYIFDQIGLQVGLGYGLKSLGDILRASKQYSMALTNYKSAVQVFAQCNDARGIAYTFNGLGLLFADVGNGADAGTCLAHAANYFDGMGMHFGRSQGIRGMRQLTRQQQLTDRQVRDLRCGGGGQLPLPGSISKEAECGPPQRLDVLQSGWQLLNRYRRDNVRYLRSEKAQVWNGVKRADCSSFVQHALIAAGHGFARVGRLTTQRLQHDPFWSEQFQEIPANASKPGDIILQGNQHMGIFSGLRDGEPRGFQMGLASNASELTWGKKGATASLGSEMRFFRLKPQRND